MILFPYRKLGTLLRLPLNNNNMSLCSFTSATQGVHSKKFRHSKINVRRWHMLSSFNQPRRVPVSVTNRENIYRAHASTEASPATDTEPVHKYETIPGPAPKPVLGNRFIFSKYGEFPLHRFWDSVFKMRSRHGDVVKIAAVKPGLDMVWLFNPEHIRMLYKAEDQCPIRPPFDLLQAYRRSRPEVFTSAGLVNGNGPEWKRLRKAIPSLLKFQTIASYRERQALVAHDLATAIKSHSSHNNTAISKDPSCNLVPSKSTRTKSTSFKSSQVLPENQTFCQRIAHDIPDVMQLLFRYTLEAVGVVALGRFQGCLTQNNTGAAEIITANENFLTSLGESIFALPLHTIFATPNYRRLRDAHDHINRVVEASFLDLESAFQESPSKLEREQPFVWSLMTNSQLSRQDRLLILIEVFMGGIDATASTLAFCLYFLARSPHWQEELHREVRGLNLTSDSLQDLPVLRGVLKESYRLRPSPSGVARILQRDVVVGGYEIKRGVLVQAIPFLASRAPTQFADPDVFNPGRWIRRDLQTKDGERDLLSQSFIMEDETSREADPDASSDAATAGNHPGFRETGLGQVLRLNMMPAAPIAIRFIERH
ncbi:cytochrome P450 302a1, mitochondrial [Hyalella azteca]|uniref:Cytochrome P450 302a1, mitochondrial n=1 Tax=Hyalella azteca TaxID=294128 RepID=A0A8B7NCY8_HYAAZ|nr:cytochrome P450 302a1, mitochondrial [Hyalella azteca]